MGKGTILALATFLLAGCATSDPLSSSIGLNGGATRHPEHAQQLIAYNIPRAMLGVDLIAWSRTHYEVRVYEPVLTADPRYHFNLALNHDINADDAVRFDVDESTGLLRGMNVVVQGQSTNILQQVAGAVGAAAGLGNVRVFTAEFHPGRHPSTPMCPSLRPAKDPTLVARTQFDPLDATSITSARTLLRTALKAFAMSPGNRVRITSRCADRMSDDLDLGVARATVPAPTNVLQGDALHATEIPSAMVAEDQGLCTRAICAPAMLPFVIAVQAPAGAEARATISLPDASSMVVIDVPRSSLVQTTTAATFRSGLVQSVTTTRPSETLAVVSVPVTVIRAFAGAFSEILHLRVDIANGGTGTAGAGPSAPAGTLTAPQAQAAAEPPGREAPQVFLYAATSGVPAAYVNSASGTAAPAEAAAPVDPGAAAEPAAHAGHQ